MRSKSMDCCTVNGLEKMFGPTMAKLDAQAYTKRGPSQISRYMVGFLQSQGLEGQSLLDIGCGAGALLLELLKAGAEKGVGVDASPAYIQAAESLSQKLQMHNRAQFAVMDFAQEGEKVAAADIVLMQRVVCCYPKMQELVVPATQHARRFLALVYPRDNWWMQSGAFLLNFGLTLIRREFRFFIHPPAEIMAIVLAQGFAQVYHRPSGPWHVAIFQRPA